MRTQARGALLALLVATLVSRPAGAQTESPVQFAQRYFSVMQRGDWSGVARLMHPEALRSFKTMFAPIVAADREGAVARNLFGVRDAAAFDRADAAVLFTSLMRQMAASSPEFAQVLSGARMTFIGAVPEAGTEVQHVVYRMTTSASGVEIEKLGVIALRPHGRSWAAVLSGDIKGLAAAVAARRR